MGSGRGGNFEAIAKYFASKNVEITCISNIEDAPILTKAKNMDINAVFLPFKENLKYFKENKFDLVALAGYMRILPDTVLKEMGKIINIHPSLLPAFKGSANAIQEAFLSGVKVSGITVHWVTSDIDGGKIIAQYPVFLTNEMHIDEFEQEIHTIEHKLYPIVIDKLLEDKVFEFQDLIGSSCLGGKCDSSCSGKGDATSGGCGGCHNH